MRCSNCGAETGNSNFCINCGASMKQMNCQTNVNGINGMNYQTNVNGVNGANYQTNVNGVNGTNYQTNVNGVNGANYQTNVNGVNGANYQTNVNGVNGANYQTNVNGVNGANYQTNVNGMNGMNNQAGVNGTSYYNSMYDTMKNPFESLNQKPVGYSAQALNNPDNTQIHGDNHNNRTQHNAGNHNNHNNGPHNMGGNHNNHNNGPHNMGGNQNNHNNGQHNMGGNHNNYNQQNAGNNYNNHNNGQHSAGGNHNNRKQGNKNNMALAIILASIAVIAICATIIIIVVCNKNKKSDAPANNSTIENPFDIDATKETTSEYAVTTEETTEATTEATTEPTTEEAKENYDEIIFPELKKYEFSFSSGVGGWATMLRFEDNGEFSGSYYDSDMGDIGDEYPNGVEYFCSFKGKLDTLTKIDDYTYKTTIKNLDITSGKADTYEYIEGVKRIYSDPYGLTDAKDIYIYLPGKKVSSLPGSYYEWVSFNLKDEALNDLDTMPFYGLYNENAETGFSSYEIDEAYGVKDGLMGSTNGDISGFYEVSSTTVSTDLFTLNLPEDWVGNVVCSCNDYGDEFTIAFYEKNNYNSGYGGFLCSVTTFAKDDDSFINIPSKDECGLFKDANGVEHNIVLVYPTDVQYVEEYADIYMKLFEETSSFYKTITPAN